MSSRESICWDCKNARAHLCAWIGRGENIWDGGKKEKRSVNTKKTKRRIYVHIVTSVDILNQMQKERGKW